MCRSQTRTRREGWWWGADNTTVKIIDHQNRMHQWVYNPRIDRSRIFSLKTPAVFSVASSVVDYTFLLIVLSLSSWLLSQLKMGFIVKIMLCMFVFVIFCSSLLLPVFKMFLYLPLL